MAKITRSVFLILILFFSTVGYVSAHLEGGDDVVVDGYSIDFGYIPGQLNSDENSTLVFNILDDATAAPTSFDDLFLQIVKDDELVFAGTITEKFAGNTSLLYTFGEEGTYSLVAQFRNNEQTFAEHEFIVQVEGGRPARTYSVTLFLLAVIAVLAYSLFHKKSRKGTVKV